MQKGIRWPIASQYPGLELDGHAVLQAGNGREALDLLAHVVPQLVLTDVLMPLVDGIALLQAIKARTDLATIPVILMTAAGRERAVAAGADAVLSKPFELDVLDAVLQPWLSPPTAPRTSARLT